MRGKCRGGKGRKEARDKQKERKYRTGEGEKRLGRKREGGELMRGKEKRRNEGRR